MGMMIDELQKYINALRKCAKEHENDMTFTGHIIVSDLCRDTANLLEELEQEPIIDKIRAEIKALTSNRGFLSCDIDYIHKEIDAVFDKYKAESEVDNGNDD